MSAFAPISNPINCDWGKKCFGNYLGNDENLWKEYDATELITKYKGNSFKILIDQGTSDNFLHQKQLLPDNFVNAAKSVVMCSFILFFFVFSFCLGVFNVKMQIFNKKLVWRVIALCKFVFKNKNNKN